MLSWGPPISISRTKLLTLFTWSWFQNKSGPHATDNFLWVNPWAAINTTYSIRSDYIHMFDYYKSFHKKKRL